MRLFVQVTAFTLIWYGLAKGQPEEVRNPRTSPADIAAGEKTFRSHCASCHGFKGEGARGPALASAELFRGASDAELLRNISDGIPGTEMPGLFYSPDRVWQVIAYIRSLRATGAASITGDRTRGERLFRDNGCQGCHRVNGEGGRMGPDLTSIAKSRSAAHLLDAVVSPGGYVAPRYFTVNAVQKSGQKTSGFLLNEDTYTVQIIDANQNLVSLERAGLQSMEIDKSSKMPSYKGKLSQEQLNDLLAYLHALRGGAQ